MRFMKKGILVLSSFITAVCLLFGFPLLSMAAGMSVSVDNATVTQGENVLFTVSFEGNELSYAYVEASGEGAIIGGMTEMFGDDSSYQSTLSKTFSLFAGGSGEGTIHVTGYVSYLDENGNPQDSEFYSQDVVVSVASTKEQETSPNRGASPDGELKNSDGTPINGRPVPEEGTQEENLSGDKKNKTSGKEEQSTKGSEKESATGKVSTDKGGSKGIWIWLLSGIVVVLAAAIIAVVLIRRRYKMITEEEDLKDEEEPQMDEEEPQMDEEDEADPANNKNNDDLS